MNQQQDAQSGFKHKLVKIELLTEIKNRIKDYQQIEDGTESEENLEDVDVQLFKNENAYWNTFGDRDIIHFACEMGRLDIVKKLLKDGVDIESKDGFGWTPLIYAAWQGHVDLVKYLVSKKADIAVLDNNGVGAVERAEERFYYEEQQQIIQYLGSKFLPINEDHFR